MDEWRFILVSYVKIIPITFLFILQKRFGIHNGRVASETDPRFGDIVVLEREAVEML